MAPRSLGSVALLWATVLLLALGGLLIFPPTASASAPAVVGHGEEDWTSGSSVNASISVSGDYLVLLGYHASGATISATWNGDAMTLDHTNCNGSNCVSSYWLASPDLGSHTLTFNFSTGRGSILWIDFSGADGSALHDAASYDATGTLHLDMSNTAGLTDDLGITAAFCDNPYILYATQTVDQTKLDQTTDHAAGDSADSYGLDSEIRWVNGTGVGQGGCNWAGLYTFVRGISPGVVLDSAIETLLADGSHSILADMTWSGFTPTVVWISAVRTDELDAHHFWTTQAPFFGSTFSTNEVLGQALPNGTWRVQAHALDSSGTQYNSTGFVDIDIGGNPFLTLTATDNPGDYVFSVTNAPITMNPSGEGYTFSASAAALAARGGLRIDANGCAYTVTEDGTSTNCTGAAKYNWLQQSFPLLTWPMSIFGAARNAWIASASSTTSYSLAMPAHGDWIPAIVLVDSASSGRGIGQYISAERQQFFRSIMAFGVWVAFILYMRRKAWSLL